MNRIGDPYYAGDAKRKASPSKMLLLRRKPEMIQPPINPARKQYKRHTGESRYPAAFKARHYWFGLDSGSSPNGEIHGFFSRDEQVRRFTYFCAFVLPAVPPGTRR